jgi:hypothetical protein
MAATASDDGEIRRRSLASKLVSTIASQATAAGGRVQRDDTMIATASDDREVGLWKLRC